MIRFPKTPRLAEVLKEDVHKRWRSLHTVVEEKVDGANAGIQFHPTEGLQLQSRGHVLRGGAGEAQFSHFHAWAWEREPALRAALGTERLLYGEWCFAKNRAFYDALPDWFLGFDVLEVTTGTFLPTPARDAVLRAAGVVSAPRLWSGPYAKAGAFRSFLGPSKLKTAGWREALLKEGQRAGVKDILKETDDSQWMEGVYIRVETESQVIARIKLHREDFGKCHDGWGEHALVRNALRAPSRKT
jgi:hypothetical protein